MEFIVKILWHGRNGEICLSFVAIWLITSYVDSSLFFFGILSTRSIQAEIDPDCKNLDDTVKYHDTTSKNSNWFRSEDDMCKNVASGHRDKFVEDKIKEGYLFKFTTLHEKSLLLVRINWENELIAAKTCWLYLTNVCFSPI